ncbi:MAG: ImmA/IrrE family metallo-endopeptidase [Christensenella sp.]|uniref:ImmA/IrrE family metallo-endopeptidase n=1 Tax=Christensenella sp. TaxID=1935934 RepID=UPI002B220878|nr:ImmA/IrrE family metallo-endopeptidase [Christensenella sp.]MEA5004130.1 ImmA/IrrE family metallo-endopeptidase [Christensenella sp.]
MATVRFPVKPNVLTWAINSSGYDCDELRVSFPKLDSWLSGEEIPTFKQLGALAKKMHIPLGYLVLNETPEEKIDLLNFRTINSDRLEKPSRELIDTIYDMQLKQDWMHDYRLSEEMDKLEFIGSLNSESKINISEATSNIRKKIEIELEWYNHFTKPDDAFSYLRNLLSKIGILVMVNGIVGSNTHRPLNLEEFRAFAMVDDYAPLIFINGKDSKAGRLFSLCHELAHLWLGENSLYNDTCGEMNNKQYRSQKEVICNAIAAEMLVPNSMFKKHWQQTQSDLNLKINNLARRFNVSNIVIARRALDNAFITDRDYYQINNQVEENVEKMKKSSGGNHYKTIAFTIDRAFFKSVNRSLKEGKTQFTEAYRLTGVKAKTFQHLESELGV